MPPDTPKRPFSPRDFAPEEFWEFLASHVEAKPGAGAFRLFGHRLLIMRPDALVDLQRNLEATVGLSSKGFLYLAGEKTGREGHALLDPIDAPAASSADEPARIADSVAPLGFLGWGRFEVAPVDLGAHRYLVVVENSPIAEAYGESEKPVCHLLAGWLAGSVGRALGREFLCEELSCRVQGKPRCEFQLRPMPSP